MFAYNFKYIYISIYVRVVVTIRWKLIGEGVVLYNNGSSINKQSGIVKKKEGDNEVDDDDDAVTYMHNLYHDQLEFLKKAKDLFNDILDRA